MPSNMSYKNFSIKPFEVPKSQFQLRGFRLSPSSHRHFNQSLGIPLVTQADTVFNGKEIGSSCYVESSKYRFIRTSNITEKALIDCSSVEYCKPNLTNILRGGEILIAEDGGGDGLGEVCLYEKDINYSDYLCNGALAIVVHNVDARMYVLGMLKSNYFKEFLDNNTPLASTIRHSNGIAKSFKFPEYSGKNDAHIVLSLLMQNLISKEQQIASRNVAIDDMISNTLGIGKHGHLDTCKSFFIKNEFKFSGGLYNHTYLDLHHSIKNYSDGFFPLLEKYDAKRGQNLQISNIGQSHYSNEAKTGFNKLVTTMEISDARTIFKYRYLGNKKQLAVVPEGAVMLSADGTVGKSICVIKSHFISNIHQWILTPKIAKAPIYERVFLSCFLQWLRNQNYFEYIKDKANGGGIKEPHLDNYISIPKFNRSLQKTISTLYTNDVAKTVNDISSYLINETIRNKELGIWELNMECFDLKDKASRLVKAITLNEKVDPTIYLA